VVILGAVLVVAAVMLGTGLAAAVVVLGMALAVAVVVLGPMLAVAVAVLGTVLAVAVVVLGAVWAVVGVGVIRRCAGGGLCDVVVGAGVIGRCTGCALCVGPSSSEYEYSYTPSSTFASTTFGACMISVPWEKKETPHPAKHISIYPYRRTAAVTVPPSLPPTSQP
jgi:hypothetical protein